RQRRHEGDRRGPRRRARGPLAPGDPRPLRAGGGGVTQAPFGRRLAEVLAAESVGSYRLLRCTDPGGPAPEAGQFYMLAAAERGGGGEDERPYLPRAFSYLRHRDGQLEFLLDDVGPGTRRLRELREGDGLWL